MKDKNVLLAVGLLLVGGYLLYKKHKTTKKQTT